MTSNHPMRLMIRNAGIARAQDRIACASPFRISVRHSIFFSLVGLFFLGLLLA